MKKILAILAVSVGFAGAASAAILLVNDGTTSFTADANWTDADTSLEGGTHTFDIDPGVTLTATTGRFFIETKDGLNGGATLVIDGGGTFESVQTSTYAAFRLGHLTGNGIGSLEIKGGSTLSLSTLVTDFGSDGNGDGGAIVLNGLGSTFVAPNAYTGDASGGMVAGSGGWSAVSVTVLGGEIEVTDLGDRTQLTVVIPEPATLGMVAAMGGGLLFIRRRLMM